MKRTSVQAVVSAVVGAVAALIAGMAGASWPVSVCIGAAVAAAWFALATRRDRRRRALAQAPFPDAWRQTLRQYVRYYRDLPPAEQRRFELAVAVFLDEQVITGPRGARLDDELRVLVAASAVVLCFGCPGYAYPRLRDIVVYDQAFDDEYREGGKNADILGMVHAQGPILFSAHSLRRGFMGERDGDNVGLHEFAHVLDFEAGHADGIPNFLPWQALRPWVEQVRLEIARVEEGRSLLRSYAATNEAEFFAVATEVFFEKPAALKARHPQLYELMCQAYGQDPAALQQSPPSPRTMA